MLLPTTFLFRYQVAIHRDIQLPRSKGSLLGLGAESQFPWLICDRETLPFADVRMAWNDKGLALQIELNGRTVPLDHPSFRQKNQPAIHAWIDTRPTPDSHRAGRFCTQWRLILGDPEGSSLTIEPVAIARAREEATLPNADAVLANYESLKDGYRLEAWFSRESLPGFDPESSSQLGFFYQIEEPEFGTQMPWESTGFPVESDPSLWLTLLLEE